MPSEKVLTAKQELVASLVEKLGGAVSGVLVDYKGINVADDTKLRRELREAGVEYMVVKNTLLRRAFQAVGYEDLCSALEGTTAIAMSKEDAVAPAKILAKYADAHKDSAFALKAGFVEGKQLDAAGIGEIAKLPSREQLIVQVLGMLQGNIRGLAVALNAIAEQKESA